MASRSPALERSAAIAKHTRVQPSKSYHGMRLTRSLMLRLTFRSCSASATDEKRELSRNTTAVGAEISQE